MSKLNTMYICTYIRMVDLGTWTLFKMFGASCNNLALVVNNLNQNTLGVKKVAAKN